MVTMRMMRQAALVSRGGAGTGWNAGCGGAAACGQKSLVEYVRGPEVRDQ